MRKQKETLSVPWLNKEISINFERLTDQVFIPKWVRYEHIQRFVFASQFVKDKIVVDCACGSGIGTDLFLKAGAKFVEAIDSSESSIAVARSRSNATNVHFQVGNAISLPLPNHIADVYIALETIEHIQQDQAFLNEVLRVIKLEGLFICSTPNRTVTNPGTTMTHKPWNPFHVREYTQQEFVDRLKTVFQSIELYGQNCQSPLKINMMEKLGKILPSSYIILLNQIMKFPLLIFDRLERHAVLPLEAGQQYEYVVAICRPRNNYESCFRTARDDKD